MDLPSGYNSQKTAKPLRHWQQSRQMKLMDQARAAGRLCPQQLGALLYGSKEELEKTVAAFERVDKVLGKDTFKLPPIYGGLSEQQMILEGLRTGKATFQDGIKYKHHAFDNETHVFGLGNANPFGLTMFLFVSPIKLLGTDEQVQCWASLAVSGQIIGSYAQTEMAHGTNVAGIETTATFDHHTDEFVIHSPTLTSAKYSFLMAGPGGVGICASHTVLMARLIVDSKDYGVHPFIVQLRSLEDFKPMPGIELLDIGPKFSYNSTDNGCIIFHHARIPRGNLLSRYASVSRTGNYISNPFRQKLTYGGMLNGRNTMVRNAGFQLGKAVTIATRYSIVREQGAPLDADSHTETAIINYKHQHYRLLTLISQAYAILFVSQRCQTLYQDLVAAQRDGDHSALPLVHATMCGLKAWATQTAADGAEDARKMCGGHGYLHTSGVPDLVAGLYGTCTFEGENWVMWGQVARYLMKGLDAADLPADMAYIDRNHSTNDITCEARGKEFLNTRVLIEVFKHRASRLIREVHIKLNDEMAKGTSRPKAMNKFVLELTVAARSHIELYILEGWVLKLDRIRNSTSIQTMEGLHRLLTLFALTIIASPLAPYTSTFISDMYFSYTQIFEITQLIDELLKELLPEIVILIDAFFFTDGCLSSALGCRDGDVYRRLMAWTEQLPINVETDGGVFKRGWERYIRPFLEENGGLPEGRVVAKL